MRRYRIWIAAAVGALGAVLGAFYDQLPSVWRLAALTALALLAGATVVLVDTGVSDQLARRRRRGLVERLARLPAARRDVDEVGPGSPPHPGKGVRQDDELRRLRDFRRAREAEQGVAELLPENLRQAMRLVNHLRLLTVIAEDRGVFGGEPPVTHEHLAKWVLLGELWPRLGAALTRRPDDVAGMERAASVAELDSVLASAAPGLAGSDELLNALRRTPPLGEVLDRLVRFRPAEPVPARGPDYDAGAEELLSEIIDRHDRERAERGAGAGRGPLLLVLHGPHPGVGQVAQGLAQRIAGTYPDGLLSTSLCDPDPVPLGEVLRSFLLALHWPAEQVPGEVRERSAIFRSLTARRRMLILILGAGIEDQVLDLLPYGSGSVVIVAGERDLGPALGAPSWSVRPGPPADRPVEPEPEMSGPR